MSSICNAVRNRKDDFKKIILDAIGRGKDKPVKIMDLASGPCRDVVEILSDPLLAKKEFVIHCYDNDERDIAYARHLIRGDCRVSFLKKNAVRLALMKDVERKIEHRYDPICSTGLFDYLDYRISVRLVSKLRRLLAPGGALAISDVRDKFSNPSIYFMEWVADWSFIYRDDDEFRQIFLDAGFSGDDLTCQYEQQGIMQHTVSRNS